MTDQFNNLLLEASDPTTSPLRLGRLASSGNQKLRHAVAGNPNTPSEVLWRLAVRDASAVLENKLLNFLILENPNFLAELPEFARLSLLRTAQTPLAWLDWVFAWGDQDFESSCFAKPKPCTRVTEDT